MKKGLKLTDYKNYQGKELPDMKKAAYFRQFQKTVKDSLKRIKKYKDNDLNKN